MNKKKALELFAKASTPQELFVDVIEKLNSIDGKVDKVNKDMDEQLVHFIENRPRTESELRAMIRELVPAYIPEPEKGADGKSYSEMSCWR